MPLFLFLIKRKCHLKKSLNAVVSKRSLPQAQATCTSNPDALKHLQVGGFFLGLAFKG